MYCLFDCIFLIFIKIIKKKKLCLCLLVKNKKKYVIFNLKYL